MINKLIDEPYWTELPEIIDEICGSKDCFFISEDEEIDYMIGKQSMDRVPYHFFTKLFKSSNQKKFWKESFKNERSLNSFSIRLLGIKETVLNQDLETVKQMLFYEALRRVFKLPNKDKPKGDIIIKRIELENDLNNSYKMLNELRLPND